MDRTVKVWDIASGQELLTLEGRTGLVTSVAISPDGNHILSGSRDNTLRIWDGSPARD
jgi:WD40 repeat protein